MNDYQKSYSIIDLKEAIDIWWHIKEEPWVLEERFNLPIQTIKKVVKGLIPDPTAHITKYFDDEFYEDLSLFDKDDQENDDFLFDF